VSRWGFSSLRSSVLLVIRELHFMSLIIGIAPGNVEIGGAALLTLSR